VSAVLAISLLVALIFVPASVWASVKGWQFAKRYWPMKLPVILAIGAITAGIVATYLSVATIYRELADGILAEIFRWFTILGILALFFLPIMNIAYLVWLDRHRGLKDRRVE
jgi:hypothetical protein